MTERRLVQMSINYDDLFEFFSGLITIANIPQDAKLISIYDDWQKQRMQFLLESEYFSVVDPGKNVPELKLIAVRKTRWEASAAIEAGQPVSLTHYFSIKPHDMDGDGVGLIQMAVAVQDIEAGAQVEYDPNRDTRDFAINFDFASNTAEDFENEA